MAVTAQQGVGTSHNKLLEKPWLESLLLWCWHSSAELCFESRHRKSIHLDLTGADFCSRWMSSLLWLNRCIILLTWSLSPSGGGGGGAGWGLSPVGFHSWRSPRVQESALSPGQRQEWGQTRPTQTLSELARRPGRPPSLPRLPLDSAALCSNREKGRMLTRSDAVPKLTV